MQTGLLWFDNDPNRELAAKVEDAARRYREKFGVAPDTCYVSRAALSGGECLVRLKDFGGLALRLVPAGNILQHHFWVGIEDRLERRSP
jgi:hypothetical protein